MTVLSESAENEYRVHYQKWKLLLAGLFFLLYGGFSIFVLNETGWLRLSLNWLMLGMGLFMLVAPLVHRGAVLTVNAKGLYINEIWGRARLVAWEEVTTVAFIRTPAGLTGSLPNLVFTLTPAGNRQRQASVLLLFLNRPRSEVFDAVADHAPERVSFEFP